MRESAGRPRRRFCLAAARSEDSGSYSLVASNAYGSVTGTVAQISVSPVLAWGDNSAGQTAVPMGTTDVVALAAGGDHSLALRASNAIAAWGDNSSGQSNVPQPGGNVVAVADGDAHSLALRSDGTVIAWGDNTYGQTNVPASATNVVAIAAGGFHSLALRLDGTVVAWGSDSGGQRTVPASATNVVAIAAGDDYSLALQADGTLVSLGTPVPASRSGNQCGGYCRRGQTRAGVASRRGPHCVGSQLLRPNIRARLRQLMWLGLPLAATIAWPCWPTAPWSAGAPITLVRPRCQPSATNISAISAGGAHSLALAGNGSATPRLSTLRQSGHDRSTHVLSAGSLERRHGRLSMAT